MSFASRATLCSVERKLVFFIVWIWAGIPQKTKAGIHSGNDDYVEWFEEGDLSFNLHLYCKSVYIWKYQNNRGSKNRIRKQYQVYNPKSIKF